ncbi:aspartate-semialdehyde dehydrogenase [Flavobacteriaceae bacterium]|nr:aspartate-semialdehyde dehydrogenase [Flavobacteriaceae bacterium]MDC1279592.1 aspartate-semialdehyde dehydrogenase [Flavobacteriaceae bacterium]MDC1336718.1 aspartate-semialdehyde dehydrogenase [Flavobacteriaceae bacterium]MDC1337589.1 aspartate-semialdehyde dehydrogenase [Flavobacteriaceae bacterium]
MRIAIVGATGMVGSVMLDVIKERSLHFDELLLVASKNSVGKIVSYCGKDYTVIDLGEALLKQPDIAIFSAGSETSLLWAPKFAKIGTVVIDNSSAWRMDPSKKLIIPEINGSEIEKNDKIIANPNCSTIQMLMVLAPIHKKYGIKRVIVSTYQSITGTGLKALKQLENEYNDIEGEMAYNYRIHQNAIPHCDDFLENGYTKEEMKLSNETHKILDPSISVSATAVRIPVIGGHSESINIELEKSFDVSEITQLLKETNGVIVKDDILNLDYPMPLYSKNKDEVFVGRIRKDFSHEKAINLWVVADNLRKGAATNAVQITEKIVADFL